MNNKYVQNYRKRMREEKSRQLLIIPKKPKITNAERQKAYRERLKIKAVKNREASFALLEPQSVSMPKNPKLLMPSAKRFKS